MRVLVTEEQFKKIMTSIEVDEQTEAEPVSPEPEAGTSDEQTGAEGYPEVTTWANIVGSKLTRGVGNKIDNTPRPDLVDRSGPANQLK